MSSVAINPLAPGIGPDADESIVFNRNREFGHNVYLFSLHFNPLKTTREFLTDVPRGTAKKYQTEYRMAAVNTPNDIPSFLKIRDGLQKVFQRTDEVNPRNKYYADVAEAAANIARDLVREVAGGIDGPERVAPAIWITNVRSDRLPVHGGQRDWDGWGTPAFEKVFPEFMAEVKAYRRRQWLWCEQKVAEGDLLHSTNKSYDIGLVHRKAAKSIAANASEHPWVDGTTFGKIEPCPFCGKGTSPNHPKCSHCNEIINVKLNEAIKARLAADAKEPEAVPASF